MTFSAPRVPPVLETQKVMVNDIEETPVACVQLGDNMNEPPGGDPGVVRTIGTVTVAGNASPVVGDTVTYTDICRAPALLLTQLLQVVTLLTLSTPLLLPVRPSLVAL